MDVKGSTKTIFLAQLAIKLDQIRIALVFQLDGPVIGAGKAERAGCEGIVCSPRELGIVADVAPDLVRVTPGIRPEETAGGDDQARVATPEAALIHGATWLVIGRPITRAPDPVAAAAVLAERLRTNATPEREE